MDIENYIKQIEQQMKEQDSIYHSAAVKYGLSDTALWILYHVSDMSEIYTQQDLCQQCFFSKQTVNTAVNSLIKSGCARLEAIDGSRNRKRIILTEKGRELTENTTDNLKRVEIKAYGKLSDDELKAFLDISVKLNGFLREETDKLFYNKATGGQNE